MVEKLRINPNEITPQDVVPTGDGTNRDWVPAAAAATGVGVGVGVGVAYESGILDYLLDPNGVLAQENEAAPVVDYTPPGPDGQQGQSVNEQVGATEGVAVVRFAEGTTAVVRETQSAAINPDTGEILTDPTTGGPAVGMQFFYSTAMGKDELVALGTINYSLPPTTGNSIPNSGNYNRFPEMSVDEWRTGASRTIWANYTDAYPGTDEQREENSSYDNIWAAAQEAKIQNLADDGDRVFVQVASCNPGDIRSQLDTHDIFDISTGTLVRVTADNVDAILAGDPNLFYEITADQVGGKMPYDEECLIPGDNPPATRTATSTPEPATPTPEGETVCAVVQEVPLGETLPRGSQNVLVRRIMTNNASGELEVRYDAYSQTGAGITRTDDNRGTPGSIMIWHNPQGSMEQLIDEGWIDYQKMLENFGDGRFYVDGQERDVAPPDVCDTNEPQPDPSPTPEQTATSTPEQTATPDRPQREGAVYLPIIRADDPCYDGPLCP